MALWVCGGTAGCGTKYAVGLFRCPRCHNDEFFEDGDPMGKISRAAGASVAEQVPAEATPTAEPEPEPTPDAEEPLDVTEYMAGPAEPVVEEEGGEESSLGSSSSASTEKPPTNSEPSSKTRQRRARGTASRSVKDQTENSSATGTAGGQETGTSAADTGGEAQL